MRLVAFSDKEKMKETCPYSLSTLYKMRCIGQYPDLTVKIGGKLCLNLDVLEEMGTQSLEKQRVKAERLQGIRNELKQ